MHAALTGGAHHLARREGPESAIAQPMQTWDGAFLYPSLFLMAGSLLRSLAENQPFTDGNKRIAWAAATVFLEINGISGDDAEDVAARMVRDGKPVVGNVAVLDGRNACSNDRNQLVGGTRSDEWLCIELRQVDIGLAVREERVQRRRIGESSDRHLVRSVPAA
jgi:prophage maintenance system killer protein